jgi:hypothetical protein
MEQALSSALGHVASNWSTDRAGLRADVARAGSHARAAAGTYAGAGSSLAGSLKA